MQLTLWTQLNKFPIKIILDSEDFLFKLVIKDEEVLIIKIFKVYEVYVCKELVWYQY